MAALLLGRGVAAGRAAARGRRGTRAAAKKRGFGDKPEPPPAPAADTAEIDAAGAAPAPAPATTPAGPLDLDSVSPFEPAAKRAAKQRADVYSPAVEQMKAPSTPQGETETAYIQFLGLYFGFLILLGLVVAGSGFLPDAADQFVADKVFPLFSPAVGLFLALSSAYGVWKAYFSPDAGQI